MIYSGYNRARVPFRMAANGANGRLRKHGGEKADTAARGKSRIPDRLQDTTLEEKPHKVFWLTTQKNYVWVPNSKKHYLSWIGYLSIDILMRFMNRERGEEFSYPVLQN